MIMSNITNIKSRGCCETIILISGWNIKLKTIGCTPGEHQFFWGILIISSSTYDLQLFTQHHMKFFW